MHAYLLSVHPILIMEYLACGDLLGYLRKSRGIDDKYHCGEGAAVEIGTYDMVSFAKQIATGMIFLASRGVCEKFIASSFKIAAKISWKSTQDDVRNNSPG